MARMFWPYLFFYISMDSCNLDKLQTIGENNYSFLAVEYNVRPISALEEVSTFPTG